MRTITRREPKATRIITRRVKEDRVPVDFISSGSITLNLALSGKGPQGGWARGRVGNIVGDGSSGKTLLALEACFWLYNNAKLLRSKNFPNVKNLKIIYDNAEGVMDFPIDKMYGQKFNDFIKWKSSRAIEQAGARYIKELARMDDGDCLLYVLDTWDAIESWAAIRRIDEALEAEGKTVKGKKQEEGEVSGSYDTEKQKYASKWFANISGRMANNANDATLLIISQVRTRIGIKFGKKMYRAGGKALDFYTHQVAWLREIEKMSKTKQGHKRVYGIESAAKVERSKVSKPHREASFQILFDYGLDDVNSMIDFIWGNKEIKFDGKMFKTRKTFIKYVEKNNREQALAKETELVWNMVEAAFEEEVNDRKRRHG